MTICVSEEEKTLQVGKEKISRKDYVISFFLLSNQTLHFDIIIANPN